RSVRYSERVRVNIPHRIASGKLPAVYLRLSVAVLGKKDLFRGRAFSRGRVAVGHWRRAGKLFAGRILIGAARVVFFFDDLFFAPRFFAFVAAEFLLELGVYFIVFGPQLDRLLRPFPGFVEITGLGVAGGQRAQNKGLFVVS